MSRPQREASTGDGSLAGCFLVEHVLVESCKLPVELKDFFCVREFLVHQDEVGITCKEEWQIFPAADDIVAISQILVIVPGRQKDDCIGDVIEKDSLFLRDVQ